MGTSLSVDQIPDPAWAKPILSFVGKSVRPEDASIFGFLGRLFGADRTNQHAKSIVDPWLAPSISFPLIDTLNLASIVYFLDHAAQLEGFTDSSEAMEKSRWSNLPYYEHSIWLPLDPLYRRTETVEVSGWPIFLGTTKGLLSNFDEIALKSDKKLGEKPKLFDLMLNDPKAYYKATAEGLSPDDTLRWVWFAYHHGAKTAESKNMPLWQAG